MNKSYRTVGNVGSDLFYAEAIDGPIVDIVNAKRSVAVVCIIGREPS
jgi:hypothetical protein